MKSLHDDLKIIEEYEEEIKFFVNSDLRLELLVNLFIEPSTIKELQEYTQQNYTSITSNLTRLEENMIIKKIKDTYHLENQAKIKLLNIILLEHNIYFLTQFEEFLNKHKVKNNKLKLLSTLPYIDNIELIQADTINPDIATEMIEENITARGSVKSVCIYLHPNCSEIITYMMTHKTDFEVIVPLHIAQYIIQHANKYKTTMPIKNKRFNIKPIIKEELNLALVVSQEKLVMGLVRCEGKFNKNCCLVSTDKTVIDWGYNLFKEYEKLKHGYLSINDLVHRNNNQ